MTGTMIRQLAPIAALVVIVPYVLSQVRRPTRWVGRLFLWSMNRTHSSLTDWGLGHVRIGKGFAILDVGCGGGRTIQKLAALAPEGRVFGVDYSLGSVDASRRLNASLIAAGRVHVQQASVSRLPFPDGTFDLVTAVETHYYWPNLVDDVRETLRAIKPGGTLILVAESYQRGRYAVVEQLVMRSLRAAYLTADEHRRLLATAGFENVQVFEARDTGWICVKGSRPVGGSHADGRGA